MGYNDIKTYSTSIERTAYRGPSYSAVGTVIPYTDGLATYPPFLIDGPSGTSTAPVDGTYLYSFNAIADVANTVVQLRKNRLDYISAYGSSAGDPISIAMGFRMKKGETVDVYLLQGAIRGNPLQGPSVGYFTQLTGILLEERVAESIP